MRRVVIAGILIGLLIVVPGNVGAAEPNPCVGTITDPAESTTVISTQGAELANGFAYKRPARIVGVGPRGTIRWVYHAGRDQGIAWSYDIDPMADGNVFVTATKQKQTVFFVLEPETGDIVWSERVDLHDTHDADLLDDDRILIANMRNYDPETGVNNDRLVIYNRTSETFVWEWRFDGRFPADGGRNYTDDWTHVNDVDRIGPGRYLASVRNFDQVIVVDRESGEIVRKLGRDDRHSIMDEQHNPQYLESRRGRPTLLVADSGNGRIVEYERGPLGWLRTWELGGDGALDWPRDADRLPNGNTLVTDSANNRVIEVTPRGRIVWEFYAPWLVYDAERMALGDEAGGPTIRDQRLGGRYDLQNGTARPAAAQTRCASMLGNWTATMTVTSPSTPPQSDTMTTQPRTTGMSDSPATNGQSTVSTVDPPTSTPGQPGFGILTAASIAVLFLLTRLLGDGWR